MANHVAAFGTPVRSVVGTGFFSTGLSRLRSRVRGSVAIEGEPGYDQGRAAWNLNIDQRPAAVVAAAAEEDFVAAVDFARENDFGVAVQATGHGVAVPADAGVLVNTSRMRAVRIDPASRTATVEPGAQWSDVLPRAQEFGLAPLLGSGSGVGVVGYTLGGGSGFLGRQYGFAADSVVGARLATADGRLLEVSADRHPDLFWAIRGGTSNFGLVTQLSFRLYPVRTVYGGGIYWPVGRAGEVADVYRDFVETAPETVTSRLALVHVPPLVHIPKELHGKWLVAVQALFDGPEAGGQTLFAPFRKLGGALEDALRTMPFSAVDSICRDPKDPIPGVVHSEVLDEIPPELIGCLTAAVARPDSPVALVEMRHQGGAFTRLPQVPSAVGIRTSGFWFNAVAAALPPAGRAGAESELAALRKAVRPWATGAVYLNGLDRFGADRVRSAYSRLTWDKLALVKQRYDPANVFRLNRNIPPVFA